MPWDGFAPGSKTGAKTAAKPEIWKDRAEFDRLGKEAKVETAKLVAAAGVDLATLRAQVQATGRACKNCHDKFQNEGDASPGAAARAAAGVGRRATATNTRTSAATRTAIARVAVVAASSGRASSRAGAGAAHHRRDEVLAQHDQVGDHRGDVHSRERHDDPPEAPVEPRQRVGGRLRHALGERARVELAVVREQGRRRPARAAEPTQATIHAPARLCDAWTSGARARCERA